MLKQVQHDRNHINILDSLLTIPLIHHFSISLFHSFTAFTLSLFLCFLHLINKHLHIHIRGIERNRTFRADYVYRVF